MKKLNIYFLGPEASLSDMVWFYGIGIIGPAVIAAATVIHIN